MMYHRERYLQHLKGKFKEWVPWLEASCRASVKIADGPASSFTVIVRWMEGDEEKEFRRLYNAANAGEIRAGCLKPYARDIILKVLDMRGKFK